jgi:membrane protein implicated in regulation of membrane protease activity
MWIFPDLPISAVVFWIIVAIVCGIIEAATLELTTIWFVIGSIVALVLASFEVPFIIQVIVFLSISLILLIYTRPLATKRLNIGKEKTNVEAIIGRHGIVIEKIDNMIGKGEVKIGGQIWSAKSSDDLSIEKDNEVEVVSVKGVHVIVRKIKKEELQ